MTRRKEKRPPVPTCDPNWPERQRRRRVEELKDLWPTLVEKRRKLAVALAKETDERRKFVLSNDLVRMKKRIRDLEAELSQLKKWKVGRKWEALDRRYENANGRKGAISGSGGKPVQGGAPE